jgi:hypothetical protein
VAENKDYPILSASDCTDFDENMEKSEKRRKERSPSFNNEHIL